MKPEWEIWLDANISPAIAKWMDAYVELPVKSSYKLNFNQLGDQEIFQIAKDYGHIILISKDADFSDLTSRLGAPPKLIKIGIGNCDNQKLWDFIRKRLLNSIDLLTNTDTAIIELN
ncbi:DUF5615 family PIN-like protein [Imperialibacter roseus]|uniref:DUF5615 family PIN-like protein n=1 Tax=Imperialibacter roseus TaxID=1324217 RepID=A0ABZ0ILK8_9BACT|nr:DUF5615 family PIN-like protein [Imperialibacter roseus]WOK05379.1 DUF5615 family PIN-like protein [Imperialibacter roseus]